MDRKSISKDNQEPTAGQEEEEEWEEWEETPDYIRSEDYNKQEEIKKNNPDENEREEKQKFIDSEILAKGYEPQEFFFYLRNFKSKIGIMQNHSFLDDGQDLDNWQLGELKLAIQEFLDFQLAQELQNQEEENKENPSRLLFGQGLKQNQMEQIMPFLNRYQPGPYLEVTQLKQTILNRNSRKIFIKLTHAKVKQQTEFLFIKSNQLSFNILTIPMKWDVERNESDIYQLRRLLQYQFPHLLIPPLPQRQEYKFTQKSVKKRCKYIERFINSVCRSEQLCTYQILVEFLMIKHNNPKTFQEKIKKEEETLLKQRQPLKPEASELSSLYNKLATKLQPMAASFNLPQFIESFETILQNLLKLSVDIKTKSDVLCQSFLKLQEVLVKISQNHGDSVVCQLEIFANLSKAFGTEGFILSQQGEIIQDALKYVKYNLEYIPELKELQQKAEYAKYKFERSEKNFANKRQKVVAQLGKDNKNQVSEQLVDSLLPVEMKDLERQTQFMNFFKNQVFQEVKRMQFEMEYEGMKNNFRDMIKKVTAGLNQRNIQWSSIINALEKVKFENL
ncbi:px domain containing protein [Stylonychia lemnae]|uniref:Px domain containing protein n=1 Tax=Stylonychia lemnae TaxID=5949 RepID=A0A078B4K0_STYLE|nr:px domain containing protein [Stylonychia lemnae]|eukprot:CDW88423.1 px domain containing protein [Stylonychia lemnae]